MRSRQRARRRDLQIQITSVVLNAKTNMIKAPTQTTQLTLAFGAGAKAEAEATKARVAAAVNFIVNSCLSKCVFLSTDLALQKKLYSSTTYAILIKEEVKAVEVGVSGYVSRLPIKNG